ncbi:hypothetical protein POVWA2_001820 [Plasmodium ovale wallikeri]|uniref:Uncharacterized protein n=1 Tax=Plasmodium ovale wallikeri TaxID=864142 RepID=A0A1A8YHH6_PLAOA|nr:hypothetical protein POVWA1_001950 [Plasmodium ovale wallikeri]SBT30997.1 hypothetical protein POVWA2_001820 [Plasmodium ovale wallikeri]
MHTQPRAAVSCCPKCEEKKARVERKRVENKAWSAKRGEQIVECKTWRAKRGEQNVECKKLNHPCTD